ncbi:MAG: type II toxin-antitoxin system VapC family toxin [Solimonas sp.]
MSAEFVLDASAAIAWASPDEFPPAPLSRAIESGVAVVPALWLYEVHHVLHMLRRRGRISDGDYADCNGAIMALRVEVDPPERRRIEAELPPLAQAFGLTVYDAAYLELALHRRIPLATLDEALRKAAVKAKVKLI